MLNRPNPFDKFAERFKGAQFLAGIEVDPDFAFRRRCRALTKVASALKDLTTDVNSGKRPAQDLFEALYTVTASINPDDSHSLFDPAICTEAYTKIVPPVPVIDREELKAGFFGRLMEKSLTVEVVTDNHLPIPSVKMLGRFAQVDDTVRLDIRDLPKLSIGLEAIGIRQFNDPDDKYLSTAILDLQDVGVTVSKASGLASVTRLPQRRSPRTPTPPPGGGHAA